MFAARLPAHAVTRRRSLVRRRGAALVEAAVVVPVLAIFLGIMMFLHAQYSAKLSSMAKSRADAWSSALHACKGGATSQGGIIESGTPSEAKDKVIDGGPSQAVRSVSGGLISKTTANNKATTTIGGYIGTVASASYVFCNEESYDEGGPLGPMKNFLNFISSFWRSGL